MWQWNYVLAVRRHREAFAELYPYKRHHHVAFVELRPGLEAPPQYSRGITSLCWGTTMNSYHEVHGIKSNRWGTTRDSHYEGPWDYVRQMRHHHELSLQESWNYVLLAHWTCFTNQSEVPIILTSCITIPSCNSCFPIHTT